MPFVMPTDQGGRPLAMPPLPSKDSLSEQYMTDSGVALLPEILLPDILGSPYIPPQQRPRLSTDGVTSGKDATSTNIDQCRNLPCGPVIHPGDTLQYASAGDCAITDSWEDLPGAGFEDEAEDEAGKGMFQKQKCPEKITGGSMLSALLAQKTQQRTSSIIKPPPGFEHLGARKISKHTSPAQGVEQTLKLAPTDDLWWLCSPNHPMYDQLPSTEQWSTTGSKKSSQETPHWRRAQKQMRVQTCVDCVFTPYKSTEYRSEFQNPGDYYRFDESHQVATF